MLVPVLLSGGVGSRLWPLSRELYPKQFIPLTSEDSLLEQTIKRAKSLPECAEPIVVCNDEHRFMVAEQLRQLDVKSAAIILEPEGKNTAPAVVVAALQAIKLDPDATLLVMPADHIVSNTSAFAEAVSKGLDFANDGKLVTFGIVPEAPETGYGYIRREDSGSDGCYPIAEFVEKPVLDVAQRYVDNGNYYWNSGMFLLGAQAYLDELQQYAASMVSAATKAFNHATKDLDFIRLNADDFAQCPSDSIDYALMEKTDKGMVVALSCGWNDVGSWSSLWDVDAKDNAGNVTKGDVILHDASNSYIHSSSRLVSALGINNAVIVETPDAVLVADKDSVQDVKAIVTELKSRNREEASVHKKVYRPWGSYESLVVSDRFQVKRIIVAPGQQLSLQMHHHRAEHWIVVRGTAYVTSGDKEFYLLEDQSTYIPMGTKHRLANNGVIELELIEVQSGSYLGEDDIVRFLDVYGRNQ